MTKYTVQFHFPNTQIMLEGVKEGWISKWRGHIVSGEAFSVTDKNGVDYTINPAMVTYMQVREDTAFR